MSESDLILNRLNELIASGKLYLKKYNASENVIKAQKYFSEAYETCVNSFGKDHTKNIEILSLLSISHNFHIGLKSSSIEVTGLLEEMKRIQLLDDNTIDADLIESNQRLATSYAQAKKYDRALENYFQALEIQSKAQEKNDVNMAHILERIGDVYRNLDNIEKAKAFYLKVLDVISRLDGDNSQITSKLKKKILRVTQWHSGYS